MSAPENRQDLASFRSVYLVARREFVIRLRSRVYRIGTALMVLLLIGYVVLQTRALNNRTSVTTVGFTSSAQILAQPLKGAARGLGQITIQHIASQAVGERLVRSGHLDVLVSGSPLSPKVLAKSQLNTALQASLTGLVKQESLAAQLAAHGLNPRALATAVSGASIHVHILTPASPQRTQQAIMGVIVAIVLSISLQIYGIQVAQGVAEEKESRIVEILLATVRPGQLLAGKVVGIGLFGLLQLVIIGAVGLILIVRTHVVSIPAVGAGVIAGGLLWFVLGFALYAVLLAAAGSLVSRVQDVQLASLPIIMALSVAYVVSLVVVLPDPSSLASTVVSLVPFLAPVAMPARMAAGAPEWQVGLAVVLTLATIGAAIWLASRIYANAVLRMGVRVALSEALHGR